MGMHMLLIGGLHGLGVDLNAVVVIKSIIGKLGVLGKVLSLILFVGLLGFYAATHFFAH